jgi:antitoxin VapB
MHSPHASEFPLSVGVVTAGIGSISEGRPRSKTIGECGHLIFLNGCRMQRHRRNLSRAPDTGYHTYLASMVEIIYSSTMRKAMHLNIKNDEAHKLATELAELTGESLTSAVTLALRERLARERRRRRTDRIAARLMKIGSQFAALEDTGRGPDEILGYDDHGLPT